MYRYSSSANQNYFRSAVPLGRDEIVRHAPSVLAEAAHESRGERYSFIPTIQVLDGLGKEGFQPFEVRQTRVRDQGRREHTKHLVRLRHPSTIEASVQEVPEIILINSHDGTTSYQLLAGFFRMVCSNGLIAGDVCNDIRVRHSGNVVDDVIEGSFRVLEDVKEIGSRIETYKSIILKPEEQSLFATASLQLRWDEGKAPVEAEHLLAPKRWEDNKPDLWTTFNRVQENMIKGGMRGRSATGRRMSTRAVSGVNENVRLNRALWTLADGLAKQKLS